MICVDVLDLWAVPKVLRHCMRGAAIHYLLVHPGWRGSLVLWLLRWCGRNPVRLPSCFESGRPGHYPEYHRESLEFLLQYIEPAYKAQIAELPERSHDELQRLARYASIQSWGWLSRTFELLQSMPEDGVALMQRTSALPGVQNYALSRGIVVRAYSAPGRIRLPVRKDYHFDHNRISPTRLVSLILYVVTIASLLPGMLSALTRQLWRVGGNTEHERFDVLALAYQADPTPGFNDLFWALELHRHHGRSILGVHARPLSTQARDFYLQRAQRLLSIRDMGRFFWRFPGKGALQVAREYLRGVFQSFSEISVLLVRGRLSIWLAAVCLRVDCKTRFFTALMQATGARVAWAMLEGNEINTLAMTLASGRVGGLCFGTSWSLPYAPCITFSLARNHVLFAWGERQKQICVQSGALVQHYVMSGYPTAGCYLPSAATGVSRPPWLVSALVRGSRSRVVTFYDNICAADIIVGCGELRALFANLLEWVAARPDVLLILKTKRRAFHVLGETLCRQISSLEKAGALIVREEKADMEAGLVADVVLGISSSTLASLAAAHGKRCVFYDRHDLLGKRYYPLGLSSVMRIHDAQDLASALDGALSLSTDTGERGGQVDSYADGEGDRRIAFYMDALLIAMGKVGEAKAAQVDATHAYEEAWGSMAVQSGTAAGF